MAYFTADELVNAFSEEFRFSVPEEFRQLIEALNEGFTIVDDGVGGSTDSSGDIKIPKDTGPGIVPMNSQFGYITFHQYDRDSALIHELGHAILVKLAISRIETDELNNAILAAATRQAVYNSEKNNTEMLDELKVILDVEYLRKKQELDAQLIEFYEGTTDE